MSRKLRKKRIKAENTT